MIASSVMVSSSARADEAADTAAARALGGDGLNLADAGDCTGAIDKLRRAEDLHHAPTTAARLGECEINVGHVVVGTERLQRLLREPIAPNAPQPFVDAMTRARHVLERALPRIASLRVSAHVPAGTKVQMTVDGEKLPDALLDNDRPVDPGKHTVVASAQGFVTKTEEISVHEGEKGSLTLELAPDLVAQAAAAREAAAAQRRAAAKQASAASSDATAGKPAASDSGRGIGLASIVAFTLGGVGLATGIVGGSIVAADSSDLNKACTNKVCPPDKQSELSSAKTWATVSTAGFAVAGAGVGVGLLMLLLNGHDSSSHEEAKVRPVIGPLYVGFEGAL